jgi:hypothetical protein
MSGLATGPDIPNKRQVSNDEEQEKECLLLGTGISWE